MKWVRLGEIGEFVRGNGLTKADLHPANTDGTLVGAIHYGQIHTYYNTYTTQTKSFVSSALAKRLEKARYGDLIIACVSEDVEGVCKAVAYLGNADICIGGDTLAYRHKQNPKFIAYVFQTTYFASLKAKYTSGVKVIRVRLENLKTLKIPLPPLKEQRVIATFLDHKCAKIAACITKKTRMLALLKEYKQALISKITTKGLNPQEHFKPSAVAWLGDIPGHWEIKKGRLLFKNQEIPNFNLECQNRLALTLDGMIRKDITCGSGLNPADFRTYQIVKQNDLIFKLIDLDNVKTSRVGLCHETGIVSSAYIRLTKINPALCVKYFYYYYYDLYLKRVYNALGTGVRSTLSSKELLEIPLPVPPLQEQHAIAAFLDHRLAKLDTLMIKLQTQIQGLKDYKSALISEAVLGQIPLKAKHAKI
ncbi:restriction endonuclease subunit S [Helicobacter suis]|uniref:restriction endonuclease subunit S n=1 Tax=Helicobacter suis TaxID=104628 RepID=UPI0013D3A9E7|nr:restriction endonuclease subunit S [Helicobacter suis]